MQWIRGSVVMCFAYRCDNSCLTCNGPGFKNCSSCPSGYLLDLGTCQMGAICKDGEYSYVIHSVIFALYGLTYFHFNKETNKHVFNRIYSASCARWLTLIYIFNESCCFVIFCYHFIMTDSSCVA